MTEEEQEKDRQAEQSTDQWQSILDEYTASDRGCVIAFFLILPAMMIKIFAVIQ
jgi:hypothetical protein